MNIQEKTSKNKVVVCEKCNKNIEVRWGIFAHDTLSRHLKGEHNNENH